MLRLDFVLCAGEHGGVGVSFSAASPDLLDDFSRKACAVFSKLLGKPMSSHKPVTLSLAKKRPGGLV